MTTPSRRIDARTRVWFIDEPALYDRDHLYAVGSLDYPDNARRFAVLVRAALELTARRGERPAIVHAHDWQTGLAPVYLRQSYAEEKRAPATA